MVARWISIRASQAFFLIVMLQLHLFSVPCRTGTCHSPVQVTAGQLAASGVVPDAIVKVLLYPGAAFRSLLGEGKSPTWDGILEDYNMTQIEAPSKAYLYRIEVVIGSYFIVGGALAGLFKPGRMSLFGILFLLWGLYKERVFDRPAGVESALLTLQMYPMLIVALLLAALGIRIDMNKVQKLTRPVARPLKSSAKTKLK